MNTEDSSQRSHDLTRRETLKLSLAVGIGSTGLTSADTAEAAPNQYREEMNKESENFDVVIVGGGIAGLSAALFLARAGKSALIYDAGEPRINAVSRVREFIGFDGKTPAEMLHIARQEAITYGAEVRQQFVTGVQPLEDGTFVVVTKNETVAAKAVVLATGVVDRVPDLANVKSTWGDDIRVCPCFDGYEVKNKKFVVFGDPGRLAHQAAWVSVWSPDVTVVTNHKFDADDKVKLNLLRIKILPREITGVVHEKEVLAAVTLDSGDEIGCDALWLASESERARSPLASMLCDVDDAGIAKVDSGGRTSRPGLFAVGCASFPWAHLAHAAAAGTNVGPVVTMYLLERHIDSLRQAHQKKHSE